MILTTILITTIVILVLITGFSPKKLKALIVGFLTPNMESGDWLPSFLKGTADEPAIRITKTPGKGYKVCIDARYLGMKAFFNGQQNHYLNALKGISWKSRLTQDSRQALIFPSKHNALLGVQNFVKAVMEQKAREAKGNRNMPAIDTVWTSASPYNYDSFMKGMSALCRAENDGDEDKADEIHDNMKDDGLL